MHIFFSVGEPSGDQHAAHLMAELRRRNPAIRCSGFGGPLMESAGLESLYRLTDLAVMGFGGVLPLIQTFRGLKRQAAEFLKRERPDVCVLIDYPGFNWHVARGAREAGIRVVYYCPPQLWAWGQWRLKKLKACVDEVLSVLPFEAEWYEARGVKVQYVGHPFFDEIAEKHLDSATCERLGKASPRRVALLPGSRNSEVYRNFPVMIEVVKRLAKRHPDVRFPVACYREEHRDFCQSLLNRQEPKLPIDLYCRKTSEIIETCECLLMVSGSVSLEVLARRKPAVVVYRGGLLMGAMARFLVQVKYMSLPNLMLNRMLMPEFPFLWGVPRVAENISHIFDRWLTDPAERDRVVGEMNELAGSAARTGGISKAATALIGDAQDTFIRAA